MLVNFFYGADKLLHCVFQQTLKIIFIALELKLEAHFFRMSNNKYLLLINDRCRIDPLLFTSFLTSHIPLFIHILYLYFGHTKPNQCEKE